MLVCALNVGRKLLWKLALGTTKHEQLHIYMLCIIRSNDAMMLHQHYTEIALSISYRRHETI